MAFKREREFESVRFERLNEIWESIGTALVPRLELVGASAGRLRWQGLQKELISATPEVNEMANK